MSETEITNRVRDTKPAIQEEPNIENKFKQELNNASVRDHSPKVAETVSLEDMIEELESEVDYYRGAAAFARLMYEDMYIQWKAERAKNEKLENTAWRRFKRWLTA